MALVLGRGKKFYDIPDEILAKYVVDEEKLKAMKENLKKFKSQGESDVEGYGEYEGTTYEGFGYYCDWYDAWSES